MLQINGVIMDPFSHNKIPKVNVIGSLTWFIIVLEENYASE
jgi:hypothetical protein